MTTSELKPNETQQLKDLQPEGWPAITPHFEFYTSVDFCLPIKVVIANKIDKLDDVQLTELNNQVANVHLLSAKTGFFVLSSISNLPTSIGCPPCFLARL